MKKLIFGTALIMFMAISANTFAATKSLKDSKAKTETKAKTKTKGTVEKKGEMKKAPVKHASAHHHHKKVTHKK